MPPSPARSRVFQIVAAVITAVAIEILFSYFTGSFEAAMYWGKITFFTGALLATFILAVVFFPVEKRDSQ